MNLKEFDYNECQPLDSRTYFSSLLNLMRHARYRIWVNMFYINLLPRGDNDYLVREYFDILKQKTSDRLNVKLLLGTKDNLTVIDAANLVVSQLAKEYNIPTKMYSGAKTFSHSKYVLVDNDISILGSHNWSNRSLSIGVDDSLFVRSDQLAEYLSNDFFKQWINS